VPAASWPTCCPATAFVPRYPENVTSHLVGSRAYAPCLVRRASVGPTQAARHVGTSPQTALRHTYASGLIAQGLHPRVIQARLGHASISETMDTYGHLFPDSDAETADALDRLFGDVAA